MNAMMAQPKQRADPAGITPPRADILSLPEESLTQISLLLNLPSALSFALAHSSFTAPANSRIWREIDLVPKSRASQEPDVCRTELSKRVESVLAQESRWSATRSIRLPAWRDGIDPLGRFLRLAGPTLRSLEIGTSPVMGNGLGNDPISDLELFDIYKPDLPNLHTLRLGNRTIRYIDTVTLLCAVSPSLRALDIDIQHHLLLVSSEFTVPVFGGQANVTDLRVVFSEPRGLHAQRILSRILAVFDRCQHVQRLSVTFAVRREDDNQQLLHILASYTELRDLYWGGLWVDLVNAVDDQTERDGHTGFLSLRRIVYGRPSPLDNDVYWDDVFDHIPLHPSLEVIWMTPKPQICQEDRSMYPAPPLLPHPTQSMFADFSSSLRGCPRLHSIRAAPNGEDNGELASFAALDRLEMSDETLIGRIRSYRNGSSELLHARMLLQYLEVDDVPFRADVTAPVDGDSVEYEGHDGSHRIKLFQLLPELTWLDYTDFEGLVIPLEVIEGMQEAEGATDEEWERRGVEVGDEAWKVLLDWKESVEAA